MTGREYDAYSPGIAPWSRFTHHWSGNEAGGEVMWLASREAVPSHASPLSGLPFKQWNLLLSFVILCIKSGADPRCETSVRLAGGDRNLRPAAT